jgi:aspartyl aminopeptidase
MDDRIEDFIGFLDASISPWHMAACLGAGLGGAGYARLDEAGPWALEPGGAYYVERGASSLVAWRMGFKPPAEAGFVVLAAHTDRPALKLKGLVGAEGEAPRAAVEVYGSPIVSTWLDRGLAVSGRLQLRAPEGARGVLVDSGGPVGLIPNLAVHLNRDINKGFEYNAQEHLQVLLGYDPGSLVTGGGARRDPWGRFVELAFPESGQALCGELFFRDARRAERIGGLVAAQGIDNAAGCHAALKAALAASAGAPAAFTPVFAFFDAEEIGSRMPEGADSGFLRDVLDRIAAVSGEGPEAAPMARARSFLVSIDAAQAYNPLYPGKYDADHAARLGGGPALKLAASRSYATGPEAEARVALACEREGIGFQKAIFRSDMRPGGTIGPVAASKLGAAAADIGIPLLAMHSIRETACSDDQVAMVRLLEGIALRGI